MLYDADCGFCLRAAGQVHRLGVEVDEGAIQATDLAAFGIDEERAVREMPVVLPDGRIEYGHRAWAAILATGPLPTRALGRVLIAPGIDRVARATYRWISEHRHRLPGGTPACALE